MVPYDRTPDERHIMSETAAVAPGVTEIVARVWYDHGHVPLPVKSDGSKAPAVPAWRGWQQRQPPYAEIAGAFASVDSDGLGVLTGVPREDGYQLLMIEAEGRAVAEGVVDRLATAMGDHDASTLWYQLEHGYREETPSGGVHWYVLVAGSAGRNTKLARRPSTEAEQADNPGCKVQVLLETRGEGGFSVIAPSAGRTHPTGKPWRVSAGNPARIPTITEDERDLIFAVASTLDEMPAAATHLPGDPQGSPIDPSTGERPGDHYNRSADWNILLRHGWTVAWRRGRLIGWRRPGKPYSEGISATTGHDPDQDRLFVFSTSTEFESETPYSKLAVLAILEHGGDYVAAAKALAADGWGGTKRQHASSVETLHGIVPPKTNTTPPPPLPPTEIVPEVVEVEEDRESVALELAAFGMTEDGVAQALASRCADRLRFCPQREMWLLWDGSRWAWDEAEQHRETVRELARMLPDNDTWKKFRQKMLSAAGIGGITRLARTDKNISVHIDSLDSHPWDLSTPGGTIDMRTGKLHPADRSRLHTRTTSVTPDYDTPAPVWERFLADTFGEDPALIQYVQRLLGLSAVGQVVEQILPFAYGSGANGKSTLLGVVSAILGRGRDGYAIALDSEALMVRKHSEHPAEIAQLAGARMVVSSEIEEGRRFAEARIKQLTGGDPISARFMRRDPFTFTPTHTLWLAGNSRPDVSTSPAIWRRVRLLPFSHVVPENSRDPHLEEKLMGEAPQILAWIAKGAADYQREGLGTPDAVKAATAEYQADSDSVSKFLEERCMMTSAGRVKTADLRTAYELFCRDSGDSPVSAKQLSQVLRDVHGVELVRSSGGRLYAGVTLYADEEPEW